MALALSILVMAGMGTGLFFIDDEGSSRGFCHGGGWEGLLLCMVLRILPLPLLGGLILLVVPLAVIPLWRSITGPRITFAAIDSGIMFESGRDWLGPIAWREITGFSTDRHFLWIAVGDPVAVLTRLGQTPGWINRRYLARRGAIPFGKYQFDRPLAEVCAVLTGLWDIRR